MWKTRTSSFHLVNDMTLTNCHTWVCRSTGSILKGQIPKYFPKIGHDFGVWTASGARDYEISPKIGYILEPHPHTHTHTPHPHPTPPPPFFRITYEYWRTNGCIHINRYCSTEIHSEVLAYCHVCWCFKSRTGLWVSVSLSVLFTQIWLTRFSVYKLRHLSLWFWALSIQ